MALYTSYYTRQLALRPESLTATDKNVEGEKTTQKSVARRTVDFTGPALAWNEKRRMVRNPSDVPGMLGVPAAALDLLPPAAYGHQQASSFAVKFAGQAPSKTRSSVNVAVWTPDGRRCLTGTQAGEFCMWDGQSFQFETIIQAHETPVRSMTFTHAANFLISGDDAGNVRYWRTNMELVKSFSAHREAIRQVAFAPGDLKFATASDDSTVRVWDFARVASEQVLAGHGGDVKCVDWHPSKALLASGSKDGLVKLWCPRAGRAVGTMHGHKGTVTAAQWSGNGNWVLTASRDQTCKVYDVRMQAELATFVGHGKDITQACWHSVHEEVFVSGAHDGSMCFWLVGRQGTQAEVRGAHEGSVWTMAWHPAGHLLVTGASDAATKFWCRARPGDPFMEQQEAEQAELAAVVATEATAAAPVRAPPPALFAPQPAAGGSGAIPGIGAAQEVQVVAPMMDIYAAAAGPQAAYEELDFRGRSSREGQREREPPPGRHSREHRHHREHRDSEREEGDRKRARREPERHQRQHQLGDGGPSRRDRSPLPAARRDLSPPPRGHRRDRSPPPPRERERRRDRSPWGGRRQGPPSREWADREGPPPPRKERYSSPPRRYPPGGPPSEPWPEYEQGPPPRYGVSGAGYGGPPPPYYGAPPPAGAPPPYGGPPPPQPYGAAPPQYGAPPPYYPPPQQQQPPSYGQRYPPPP